MNGMPREWVRGPQWAPATRARWEPVLARARSVWGELEVSSVVNGLRPSALVHLTSDEVARAAADCVRVGLALTPLELADGQWRAAVSRPDLAGDWVRAWEEADDRAIGGLLGFPDCCVEHFSGTWARERMTETVLTMRSVDGPPEGNTLLRQLGVRLVPHLPCSADCPATVDLGTGFRNLAVNLGLDVGALVEVLSLPVDYSALHGVAVVETPHFRFWAGTDYTPERVAVSRRAVPFDVPDKDTIVSEPGTTWQDNGFSSQTAMEDAHRAIYLAATGAGTVTSALDLGCGDGALLAKVAGGRPAGVPSRWVGVERDPGVAGRGIVRYPNVLIYPETIQTWSSEGDRSEYDVVFLMPGRLLEMDPRDADRVRARVAAIRGYLGRPCRVVAYAYGDVLAAHGGIEALCAKVGLRPVGGVYRSPGSEATLVELEGK